MHWETAIYICLQACKDLNVPRGLSVPDFSSLARSTSRLIASQGAGARSKTLSFKTQTITVGHDDADTLDDETPFHPAHEYGWDVEHPKRELRVGAFKIDALPISNGEYLNWLEKEGKTGDEALVPASWAGQAAESGPSRRCMARSPCSTRASGPSLRAGSSLASLPRCVFRVSPPPCARQPESDPSFTSRAGQGRSPSDVRGAVPFQPGAPRLAAARQRRLCQSAPGPADAPCRGARRLAGAGDGRWAVDVDVVDP